MKTVEDMTVKYLDRIPEKFLWAMWQDGRYIDNIVDDENDLDNIPLHTDLAMEIFNRLCLIAEEEYDNRKNDIHSYINLLTCRNT